MDKLVTLKPDGGRDLMDRIDDCSGMANTIYTVTDNLAMVADKTPSQEVREIVSATLYMMASYVQQLRIELDELGAAILQRQALATKGGAKK